MRLGGPLCVSDVKDGHPLAEAFIKACNEAGYARNDDFNGREQEGVGYHQTTTRNGKRCSTAVGYLHPDAQSAQSAGDYRRAYAKGADFEGKRCRLAWRIAMTARSHFGKCAQVSDLCGGAIGSPADA